MLSKDNIMCYSYLSQLSTAFRNYCEFCFLQEISLAEVWQKSGNFLRTHLCAICAAVLRLEHRRSEKSGNLASFAPLSAP